MMSYSTLCFHGLRLTVIHVPGDCDCGDIETITMGSSAPQGTEYFLLISATVQLSGRQISHFPWGRSAAKYIGVPFRLVASSQWSSGLAITFLPHGPASRSECDHSVKDAQTYLTPALSFNHGNCGFLRPLQKREI